MSYYGDGNNVLVKFDRVSHETETAILIEVGDSSEWIPKSQIACVDEELKEIWIPLWLAEKKGLNYD